MTCQAPDCYRPTRGGRTYCDAHQKRLQRGMSLSTPLDSTHDTSASQRTPLEAFMEAVVRYGNAESDEEFRRSRFLLMKWGRRYFNGRGGRPPVVDAREVAVSVRANGGIRGAARALGVSRNAIRRALDRLRLRRGLKLMVPSKPSESSEESEE